MSVVRLGLPDSHRLESLATAIRDALVDDDSIMEARGTIVVGVGALQALTPADTRPRIIFPLALVGRPSPMARAQMRGGDALILLDMSEAPAVRASALTTPVPVILSEGSGHDFGYLPSATLFDTIQAVTTIHAHPELSEALAQGNQNANPLEQVQMLAVRAVREVLGAAGAVDV